jgi:ssDNA-binding Zn-finger/Zn-ribbon topoisomerase 1
MIWLIVVLVLLAIIAVVAKEKLQALANKLNENQYRKKETLFTQAEQKFLAALEEAVKGKYRIFGMVRVADVIEPIARSNTSVRQTAFNRIQAKHFDFVICDPTDLRVVAAVELDDSSHARRNRRDRDDFLNQACKSAGLSLLRFPAKANYDAADIHARLAKEFESGGSPFPNLAKLCPNCGHNLVRIDGKEGALAGKSFWRCSRYPECRTVIPIVA